MELIDTFELDRRGLIAQIAALIGATALPAEAFAARPARRRTAARTLTPAQFVALSAIADTIIPKTDTPGAVGVGMPRLFDGLLATWASASHRVMMVNTIDAVDKLAMDSDKKGIAALTPARRKAMLLDYDRAALKPGPNPTEKVNALMAMMGGPPVMNPGWLKLKDLVISLYYSTEVAMTKELIYEHVPGKWVPSLKVTPETRPFSGLGGPF